MTRAKSPAIVLAALLFAGAPLHLSGQADSAPPTQVTTQEIDAHLRFLSSDLLEGRAPGTRGGELAAAYLASQLQTFGLLPGGPDSSYFQRVPIDVVRTDPGTISVRAGGKANATLTAPDQVVVWPGAARESSSASGELVFVGYGISAPEYKWDDFKGVDVRGKILLVLVNDPPAPSTEPALFGGPAMTYYGRWTYKYEEAERRGAAGMLIVHRTIPAGYPWQVVVSSNSGPQRLLPRDSSLPAPIGIRGWITDSAATALLAQAGLDLEKLRKDAESRSFRPVSTGIAMTMALKSSVSRLESQNVVGVIPGIDPKVRDQYVAYSAHWDHFGIGRPIAGDSIYNGASDNASGCAVLLAMARTAAEGIKPRRSQMFVFVTAEEAGLLGSAYFGQHPPVPASKIVADLNIDDPRMLGRFRTVEVLGDNKSSLGPALAKMLQPRGITLAPDEHPEQGHFYRSDHFSFAKVGIPAIDVKSGTDIVGRPAGWGKAQTEDFTAHRYHQPSDQYRPDFNLDGLQELAEIVYRFGFEIANGDAMPVWNADAEFRAAREASLKTR